MGGRGEDSASDGMGPIGSNCKGKFIPIIITSVDRSEGFHRAG